VKYASVASVSACRVRFSVMAQAPARATWWHAAWLQVRICMEKAGAEVQGAVLASDAFFPFSWNDGVELACKSGIKAIAHPGGSIRDQVRLHALAHTRTHMLSTLQYRSAHLLLLFSSFLFAHNKKTHKNSTRTHDDAQVCAGAPVQRTSIH